MMRGNKKESKKESSSATVELNVRDDDDELEEGGTTGAANTQSICEHCDTHCSPKHLRCLFSGDYKWGSGNMVCRKCLNVYKKDSIILRFKAEGGRRLLYYDFDWICRWKNPHGHTVFSKEEITSLGGEYPSSEDVLSDENCEYIRTKIVAYEQEEISKEPKRIRKRKSKDITSDLENEAEVLV
jgi:hypothetical protein